MTLRARLIYLLVVLAGAIPITAQGTASQADVWRTFAAQLAPGSFVAVTLKDGSRVKGHFIQVTVDSLRLKPKTRIAVPVRDVLLSEIDLVQRQREGWSSGRKVVTAAGVGTAGLFIVSFIVLITTL